MAVSRLELPYRNLVITGFLGVGKSTIGRHLARQLSVELLDVDEEIELRELMSIAKVRELYGESRLKTLEHEFCRQAALMRRAVIVTSGAALLDIRNFNALHDTGEIVVLTCELGEALRRLHMSNSELFRDTTIRGRMMSRLRRERTIIDREDLLQLDTTHLTIEEEAELLIKLWATGAREHDRFRMGPKPPILPPNKPALGLSRQHAPTIETRAKLDED